MFVSFALKKGAAPQTERSVDVGKYMMGKVTASTGFANQAAKLADELVLCRPTCLELIRLGLLGTCSRWCDTILVKSQRSEFGNSGENKTASSFPGWWLQNRSI